MSTSNPLMYAELLSNIRQISVIAALDTPSDPATEAQLSGTGQQLILRHGGQTVELSLPGQVAPNTPLQKPLIGQQELSWRLPLGALAKGADVDGAQCYHAPWSAQSLATGMGFSCRQCKAIIVKQGSIKTWKDLPSENWAEMMDFWHCHKPHDHRSTGSNGHTRNDVAEVASANRGYGANTKFTAQAGVGLIDLTTFLLTDGDCTGTKVRPASLHVHVPLHLSPSCRGTSSHGGYQEGGHFLPLRFCLLLSMVWPPIQIPKRNTRCHCSDIFVSCLPSSSEDGLHDSRHMAISAFHSVPSSRLWRSRD